MLRPLLGACAVVGPFQGPEWEPVRGLLPQDHSCRDPRCCGNLLIFCLFLIWQVQHYWHKVTRIHPSKRNVIKVPLKRWVVPSTRHEAFFGMTPEFFRGLDLHIQQWGHRRNRQQPWAQYLLSPQHQSQDLPRGSHTPSESIFCTSSFLSACLLPQNSSWEAWQIPRCLKNRQIHPALDRMEQLLLYSQEMLVPMESAISVRSHTTSRTLAISLQNLPSAQRRQFCFREFLPSSSNQQLETPTWKSRDSPQKTWTPWRETQIVGREYSGRTQDRGWAKQREGRGGDAWEIQAFGSQLSIGPGMEDGAEAKALGCRNQILAVGETDRDILIPEWENQNQMKTETRTNIEELWQSNQREAGDKDPPAQAHMGETREQLRCKTDAETQTPEWGNRDKGGGEDAEEDKASGGNENEAKGKEGEMQGQGLGKQGRVGGENDESQMPEWGKQEQIGDGIGVEIEAREERDKGQVESKDAVQTQTYGREKLSTVRQVDPIDAQALEWGEQGRDGSENVAEMQSPERAKQGQGGSEKARKTQASREENQNLPRQAIQVGWRNQGLGRGKDAGEPQTSRGKKLREVREEDWMVIQAPWWGEQGLVVSEIDREFKITRWGNQNQAGGEQRAEIQAPESDQRKDGREDGANTLAPEAEIQGQLGGKTDVETHPAGRKKKAQFSDGNGTDTQAVGKRNGKGTKREDYTESQELGEEKQGQSGNGFHERIHTSKGRNQEHSRGSDGANTRISEAENWGELASDTEGETHSAGWKKGEQAGAEYSAGIPIQGMKFPRRAGREDGPETRAAREGSQSQLESNMDRKSHSAEWKNQGQMGGEDRTEIHAREKRSQRELGSEDGVKTQRPERQSQGELESETRGNPYPRRRIWEQTRGEDAPENQAAEKRKRREAGGEDGRKIHRLRKKKLRLLRSKVSGKTCSSEWKDQGRTGCGHGAESQIQGQRIWSGTPGDDGPEPQASVGVTQGQSRSKTDGKIQTPGQGNQKKGGDEGAAEIQAVGSHRRYTAEEATASQTPRRGGEDQAGGKDAARSRLPGDCSGDEVPVGRKRSLAQPPALTISGCGAQEHKQAVAVHGVASAPCPDMKRPPLWGEVFLLASGEGAYLASQGMAAAQKHKARVSPVSQQAQPGSRRRRQRNKRVDPGKSSGLTQQPGNPQWVVPSVCPSLLCGQALQVATALQDAPTDLTVRPKWPSLKKSKRQLLESLMRRRIAHLRWGLPRRILESYLFFNLFGSCSLPLPRGSTNQELQRQQAKRQEVRGSTPGLKSPESSQSAPFAGRKSSESPTQTRALGKCPPPRPQPPSRPIPPKKPRRNRPPGGAREPQIQEEAPTANVPAPRSPRPSSDSRSWCDPERVREPFSEISRDSKVMGPGDSETAERAPSRVRTSSSRAGSGYCKEEATSWGTLEPPRLKYQQPTRWRRGSVEPAEGSGARRQASSYSANPSNFRGGVRSAAARLSATLLSKMPWASQLPKLQHSAPGLTLKDPPLPPEVGASHSGEDSVTGHTALEGDFQPPVPCCAEVALPSTESCQGQGEPGNPSGAPRNPPTYQKFSFLKHLRCFLFQRGFKK